MTTEDDELGEEHILKYLELRKWKKIGTIIHTGQVVTFSRQMVLFPGHGEFERVPLFRMREMIDFWFPTAKTGLQKKGPERERCHSEIHSFVRKNK